MKEKNQDTSEKSIQSSQNDETEYCGIVMPIAAMDGYSPEHWKDVYKILGESVALAKYSARLVSESEDIGIIHNRIIQNLYNDPIVVVDVSGKNPNVMFELGIRLAFDKPTIVIKDDRTNYSFDTSPIEHINYPSDLRYQKILEFKEALRAKIIGTVSASQNDSTYTTFLKHFGTFKVAKIEEKVVSKEDYILNSIDQLKNEIRALRYTPSHNPLINSEISYSVLKDKIKIYNYEKDSWNSDEEVPDLLTYLSKLPEIRTLFPRGSLLRAALNDISNTYNK